MLFDESDEYSTCLTRAVIFMLFISLFVLKMKMQWEFFLKEFLSVFA